MTSRLMAASLAVAATALIGSGASAATEEPAKQPSATAAPKSAPAATSYTVLSGDSLSTIALSQGLASWRPLWDANPGLSDPDMIYPGQNLVVPQQAVPERPLPAGISQAAPQAQVDAARPLASTAWSQALAQAAPAAAPQAAVVTGGGATGDIFGRIRQRESGGNYAINTGNGYYGAYQFDLPTWRSNAPAGYQNIRPDQAPPQVQDQAAQNLYARRGCSPWPNTCR